MSLLWYNISAAHLRWQLPFTDSNIKQTRSNVCCLFCPFFPEAEHTLQVIGCKETSSIGSLLRTLQRTMTSFGKRTMMEAQPGFLRAAY